ncbi:protein NODULATION SIGNALING PATHWAY 2-like [Magnolia sinica]|uniref:protein NODULATION SIGNALING PATHWAY 2-like n=1 Tax=Magnolia sinica TaxID=86752 RepID=UPI00265A3DFA|nr:protein NODULATION SIGNALING PATHWAY 2-like [Magnolia sinica]
MDVYHEEVDPHGLDIHVADLDLSSLLATPDEFSNDSSSPFLGAMPFEQMPSESVLWPTCFVGSPVKDHISYDEFFSVEDVFEGTEETSGSSVFQNEPFNEGSLSLSTKSSGTVAEETSYHPPLVLPSEEMEIDDEVGILHLHKAHGEAVEKGFVELAEVISRRISEKVGPLGTIMERVGHYLYQGEDKQADYLKLESSKNYNAAFRAFYDVCPHGRFAHFTANMAILEAMPENSKAIHIIDFDTREGIQWPSLFEALGQRQEVLVRLTLMKWKAGHGGSPQSNYEVTESRLCEYARSVGLRLEMDEMDLEELVMEKKRVMKRGGRNEWMAFNCMVGLPHMGMERSRRDAWEFIRIAKELITMRKTSCISNRGIITFGNGDGVEMEMNGGFGSFSEGCMIHLHALFESMEWHFPSHLSLARTAMECLFVGPYVSSHACFPTWQEMHETCGPPLEMGFEGCRLSKENLMEAKEMVRESESPYGVRFGGENENEMFLEWRGTPLVRVCAWK